MLLTLLAAAMAALAGISSGLARPSVAMAQPATSPPARRVLHIDVAGPPFDLAGNEAPPASETGNYRLSEFKLQDAGDWSGGGGTPELSQDPGGPGPLQRLVLRLRAKRLLDKSDLVGGGSGIGPPRYAARKHLMLSLSQSF
jgi:hypothetical protein